MKRLALCVLLLVTGQAVAEGPALNQYFNPESFRRGHPAPTRGDIYHSAEHSVRVRNQACRLARARGLSAKELKFIGEVALLHDWDPGRPPGTAARVPETIRALQRDFYGKAPLVRGARGSVLKSRFGWTRSDLNRAVAMIQRTEFPFGDSHPNPHYQRASPLARYTAMLRRLPPRDRRFVLREGAILSEYADKVSFYTQKSFRGALTSVRGLAQEINRGAGKKVMTAGKLDTPQFLAQMGKRESFALDRKLARTLGIKNLRIPLRNEVLARLGRGPTRRLSANQAGFAAYQKALARGASERRAGRIGAKAARRVMKGMRARGRSIRSVRSR
jgi:hypothetical protein